MKKNELFERRRHRRVKVNIPVKYKEILSDEISSGGRRELESECMDLSRGGMQLVTNDAFHDSDEKLLETEFVLSGTDIRLVAHIVWNKYDVELKKHRTGVEFIVVKNTDLEAIGTIA
jgi:c-di-GMP-binding flagellar brake protein YcgR